jgi:hypothetical protein
MELEPSSIDFNPKPDPRPRMENPPPVRVVAVKDVHLPAPAGIETQLDAFYVHLLGFVRDNDAPDGRLVYQAENVDMVFEVQEPPVPRDRLRPVEIELPGLPDLERRIIEQELSYERLRAILTGRDSLLLQDPAKNWVALVDMSVLR